MISLDLRPLIVLCECSISRIECSFGIQYKINAYGALLDVYSGLYGQSEGAQLAAADSGPLDEAYVGGGS